MRNFYNLLFTILLFAQLTLAQTMESLEGIQNFEKYSLENGLTVYLIENKNAPNIYGSVVCKVGQKNDPIDMPGMAHCLEHLLFKGTQELGTSDWEAEKPHYEKIISLYRMLESEKGKAQIEDLRSQIKKESQAADRYIIKGEMFGYLKKISANSNGVTYPDYTVYYNVFSPEMLEKWIYLYSHRFGTPVFRGFLCELDVLSQEYYIRTRVNRNIYDHIQTKIFNQIPEKKIQVTIKEMSLSRVVDYYNKYYVANNMCVIIAGNFKAEEVKPLIEKYFSLLPKGDNPIPTPTSLPDFSKKRVRNAYLDIPYSKLICYNTVPVKHPDFFKLQLGLSILDNSSVGLLEKQRNNRKLSTVYPLYLNSHNYGFTSYKVQSGNLFHLPNVTKTVKKEIKNIAQSQYPDSLLESIKQDKIRNFYLNSELTTNIGSFITDLFVYDLNDSIFTHYPTVINAIEKDEIARVFSDNFNSKPVILSSKPWIAFNKAKYSKPNEKSDKKQMEEMSQFGSKFDSIPLLPLSKQYIDFNLVSDTMLCDGVKLSCAPNPSNNIFSLTLHYAPSQKIRERQSKFKSISHLISDGNSTRFDFCCKTAQLGASHNFSQSNKLSLKISGNDKNFDKILNAYTGLIEEPTLHQYDRKVAKNKSPWVFRWFSHRHSADTVTHTIRMAMRTLTHVDYCGTLPIDTVFEQLKKHFDFSELSLDRYKYPNELFFSKNRDHHVKFSISGEKCGPSDRLILLLYSEYLKQKINYQIVNQQNLGYNIVNYITYPQKDSIAPNIRAYLYCEPKLMFQAIESTTKEIKQPLDTFLFICAKTSLKNQLLEQLPIERTKIEKIQNWKQEGLTKDPTISDFDNLDKLSFTEFEMFCKKVFAKKGLSITLYSRKSEIGRKKYKDFIKNFEYCDLK